MRVRQFAGAAVSRDVACAESACAALPAPFLTASLDFSHTLAVVGSQVPGLPPPPPQEASSAARKTRRRVVFIVPSLSIDPADVNPVVAQSAQIFGKNGKSCFRLCIRLCS